MWSIAAFAADAAEDRPRASMMAAPRFADRRQEDVLFQASSLISVFTGLPSMVGETGSQAYIVGEWLPQTVSFSIEATGLPGLGRDLAGGAVVIEAQHRREVLARQLGALFIAM